jgi:hypothetical protein
MQELELASASYWMESQQGWLKKGSSDFYPGGPKPQSGCQLQTNRETTQKQTREGAPARAPHLKPELYRQERPGTVGLVLAASPTFCISRRVAAKVDVIQVGLFFAYEDMGLGPVLSLG